MVFALLVVTAVGFDSREMYFFFRDVPNEAVSVPYMSSALIDLIPV